MRLWTLHPRYLDARGLVALWREGLLAQKVLYGGTKGYRQHPQLARFRDARDPESAIAAYLRHVLAEATRREYAFNPEKIADLKFRGTLAASEGQLLYEWDHLRAKLKVRDPAWLKDLRSLRRPDPHPLFRIVPGPVAEWEKVAEA